MSEINTSLLEDAQERGEVARKSSEAMLNILRDYSLTIRAKDFPLWRPTARSNGSIPGVALNVTIIATDGILGYFVYDDPNVPVLCGHIQFFSGEVRPLFSTSAKRTASRRGHNKPSRKTKLQQAIDLLQQLVPKE